MTKYLTWIVYLVYTCIAIRPILGQVTVCCFQCDVGLQTASRNERMRIAFPATNTTCDFDIRPYVDRDFIRVETSSMLLLDSVGCREEYIEIFHVHTTATERPGGRLSSLGRWCGRSYAKYVDIWGTVKIRFKSRRSQAVYMTVRSMEESYYTQEEHFNTMNVSPNPAYIYSPGYPVHYPGTLRMNWNLMLRDRDQLINVEAVEFQMEGANDYGACRYDNLTISSMLYRNETVVWCGRNGSRFFQYKSNVELSLRTDRLLDDKGFALRVYTTPVRNTSCLSTGSRKATAHTTPELLSVLPRQYERTVCSWLIQSERLNDVIQLEVIAWDNDVLLCGDRPFQIHDGIDDTGTQLVSKCGSVRPFGFIRTSGNAVYITSGLIISRPEASKHGFKIKYSAVYQYHFEDKYHEAVKSRSFMWIPVLKASLERPEVKFRSDRPFERCVHIEVQTKWLHEVNGSYLDYIHVYDGTGQNARLMGVCSGGDKSSISGSMDTLLVEVKTLVNEGFWLTIDTTSNCNGDTEVLQVTAVNQRLSFPTRRMQIDRFFPSNTECRWKIEKSVVTTGLIHVDVLQLHLTNPFFEDCRHAQNYLIAYNGLDATAGHVATLCDEHVYNVTSFTDLWLKVRVKDFQKDPKFTISFWMDTQFKCKDVTLSAGPEWSHLTSPGYPSHYPNNANCSWSLISKDPSHHVKLEIIEIQTHRCVDVATVYDGLSRRFTYLTLCNQGYTTSSVESTGRALAVTFYTDAANTDKGFKLAYYSVNPSSGSGSIRTTLAATPQFQTLLSPNYPTPYDKGIDMTWFIKADSSSSVVTVQQESVDFPRRPCRNMFDRFTAYDGSNTAAPVLGYLCSQDNDRNPATRLQSHGDSLFLHLVSAESSTAFGYTGNFRIIYSSGTAQRACLPGETERLTAVQDWQYLEFPPHSGNYPNNAKCQWRISAFNHTSTVSIEVTESDMEESYTCAYDAVTVYDGYDITSTETGIFCGNQRPEYESSGQYMYLVFKSDSVTQMSGFTLRYRVTPPTTTESGAPAEEQSVGLLVGGTLGGVFLLLVAITCFLCILGKTKRAAQQSQPREPVVYNRNNSTVYVVSPVYVGAAGSPNAAPPPPYPGISNPAYSVSPSDELPPSYHEYTSLESQQPATPGGENAHIYHTPTDGTNSFPSPPPYSESHGEDLPEHPPAYETAIRSGTGRDNSASVDTPSRQSLDTDNIRGENTAPQRSFKYEALGPV